MKPPFGQAYQNRSGTFQGEGKSDCQPPIHPLERQIDAFRNIGDEIYAKAKKRVTGLTAEGLAKDDQDGDANSVDKDGGLTFGLGGGTIRDAPRRHASRQTASTKPRKRFRRIVNDAAVVITGVRTES